MLSGADKADALRYIRAINDFLEDLDREIRSGADRLQLNSRLESNRDDATTAAERLKRIMERL